MITRFTDSDMVSLRRIATDRADKNPACDKKHSSKPSIQAHLEGVMVEAALSRYYQVPFNRRKLPRGDKGAPDLIIFGYGVEARACTIAPPILKFDSLGGFTAHVAMLGLVVGNSVAVNAWCTRADFIRFHYIRDFGMGPRFCLDEDQMRKLKDFPYVLNSAHEALAQPPAVPQIHKTQS